MSSSRTVFIVSISYSFRLPTLYPLLGVEEGISRIYRTWALDVSDDRSGLVVHELDADLGDTTTRTYPSSSQKFVHSFVSTASERASERILCCLDIASSVSDFVGKEEERTGSAEHSGDLDELDGLLGGVHYCDLKDGKLEEVRV